VIVEATVHIIQSSVIYMPVLVPLQLPESQHGRPGILGESNVILHLPELLQRRDWDLLLLHNFVAEIKLSMCSMKIFFNYRKI
jgi:hypothetical protein